jgi:hypothetical protein
VEKLETLVGFLSVVLLFGQRVIGGSGGASLVLVETFRIFEFLELRESGILLDFFLLQVLVLLLDFFDCLEKLLLCKTVCGRLKYRGLGLYIGSGFGGTYSVFPLCNA